MPSGVGSGVGVGVTVKVGVGAGLGVALGVGLNVGLGVAVGRGVFVRVRVGVEDGVGLAVAEAVGVSGSTSVVDVNTGLIADVDVNTRPAVGVALAPTDGTRSPDQNRSGDGQCMKPTCKTVNRTSSAATIQNRRISRKSIFIGCTTSPV